MNTQVDNRQNITDIDLSVLERKKFRINGDDHRILAPNTSDLNIVSSLRNAYPKLMELTNDAVEKWPKNIDGLEETELSPENKELNDVIDILADIDSKMRQLIDYIFDTNASEICVPEGSMYDPVGGMFRFEHIINSLGALYENDITSEMHKISTRVKKHTDKYTNKLI